jgi:hypothetical protein
MDFVAGTVRDGVTELPFGRLALNERLKPAFERTGGARDVLVGVRPEDLDPSTPAPMVPGCASMHSSTRSGTRAPICMRTHESMESCLAPGTLTPGQQMRRARLRLGLASVLRASSPGSTVRPAHAPLRG